VSSFSITYIYDTTEEIVAVKIDGSSLTERSSASDCETLPGSFFFDSQNGKLYVSASSGSVYGKSVVAIAKLYVSSKEKDLAGRYYDPRLTGIPRLSMRIEKTFGGVGQISIGSLKLANLDGAYDAREGYLWANADTKISLLIGYDTRTEEAAYGDFESLGTWGVDRWSNSDKVFSLDLREKKSRLETEIPVEVFNKTTYSSMADDDVGQPIPRAYGEVFGARPILINSGTKTFKVANHAIKSFDEIRLLIDEAWTTSSFTTTDEASGEFTCSAWVEGYEVAVDFKGRKNDDGTLMDNAADVVEDLLLYGGIAAADIDSAALAEAWARLDNGLFEATGLRGTLMAVSLYLNEVESLADIIARINASVGSYLIVDPTGKFSFNVFWPQVREGLTSYGDQTLLKFTPITEADKLSSKINVKYAPRLNDEWWSLETVNRTANQYDHLVDIEEVLNIEIPEISEEDDAEQWAQRHLVSDGKPRRFYRIELPATGLDIIPGDQLHIENDRRGFNEVLDVVSVDANFENGVVSLLCSNLRGWGRDSGFWGDTTIAFPSSLGGATISSWDSSWTADQKAWARQNVGFWTDSNGFADSTDPESFIISTWF